MAFRESGAEEEGQAHELAMKLDEMVLANDPGALEKGVRYMSANTRESLKRALAAAERN